MFKQFVLIAFVFFSVCSFAQSSDVIKRAVVTTAIDNREPVDEVTQVETGIDKVFFFTEIVNKADSYITHRWFLDGKLEAEIVLKIGSDRWRTYSSKNLVPELHSGQWQVEVIDQQNQVLVTRTFSY